MGDCKVHYTKHSTSRIPSARSGPATAVHCYHGFGANTGSWSYLRQPLASVLDAQVTAHDMPGFGLTQRLKDPSSYTLGFNGRVGRVLMDAELAEESIIPPFNVEAAAQAPTLESSLMFPARQMSVDMEVDLSEARAAAAESNAAAHPVRRILMGHSMGAVSAVAEAIKRPEGLAALVLVSPALVALPMEPEAEAPGKSGHTHTAGQSMEAGFAYGHLMSKPTAPPRRPRWIQRVVGLVRALVWPVAFLWVRLMITLSKPILLLLLRAAVRSRNFWVRGLRSSWYDKDKLPDELIDAYRMPQLVRGWEDGLIRFFLARVSGRGVVATFRETFLLHEVRQPATGYVRQLASLAAAHRIKVLIVHGENDQLLPVRCLIS
ncbi:hypothetical protein WJX73_002687 [Symbiochloris irregularis]|uniref:AB hydrolase-1 domain-containing protein n=1 Tax=Symbiochloris irregularis TaxID=706552 RepID=A0AAW1NLE5_9CHLO